MHDNSELLTEQALELCDKAGAADGWASEVVSRGLIDDVKAALLARELTRAELDV